jgi:DHA3 family tetracycline resistance protein-like MFS transporter
MIIQGAMAVLFTMMGFISAIYRVQTAGLNPLQLVLVGTSLELSVFIFEVPTGVVADVVSRRLSVIIGYALIGVGFFLEGSLPIFGPILLAQVIWGMGYTFTSGAEDAWLADEIGEERLTQTYLRASQLGRVGSLIGILISVGLGTVGLGLPMRVSGLGIVGLAVFLALFMPETGFRPTPREERTHWQSMTDTLRDGLRLVRGRRMLLLILGVSLFFGLSSEPLDRLWEAHLLQNFAFPRWDGLQEPVQWFGLMNVITLLVGIGVTEFIRRRVPADRLDVTIAAQLALNAVVIAGVVIFGLSANFGIAVVAIMSAQVFRSANHPLYMAWINRQIASRVRATVLSLDGQLNAIGQVVGGPILGALATAVSIPAAMVGVGILMAPALVLYAVAWRWTRLMGVPVQGETVVT